MKTVCAFLNSEGGTLLIGVADTGVPKGLADDLKHFVDHQNVDGFELRLRQALSRTISPTRTSWWRSRFLTSTASRSAASTSVGPRTPDVKQWRVR
jgi:hypothetical protein